MTDSFINHEIKFSNQIAESVEKIKKELKELFESKKELTIDDKKNVIIKTLILKCLSVPKDASNAKRNAYVKLVFPKEIGRVTIENIDEALDEQPDNSLYETINLKHDGRIKSEKLYYNHDFVDNNGPLNDVEKDYFENYNLSNEGKKQFLRCRKKLIFCIHYNENKNPLCNLY